MRCLVLLIGAVAMDAQHRRGAGVIVDKQREEVSMLERKGTPDNAFISSTPWLEGGGPVIASTENFCKHLSNNEMSNVMNHCSDYADSASCGTTADPKTYTEGTAQAGGAYTLCEWRDVGSCTSQTGRQLAFTDLAAAPDSCWTSHNQTRADGPEGANYTAEKCRNECSASDNCKYWQYFRGVCDHYCDEAGEFTVTIDHLGYSSGECADNPGQCLDASTHKCPWTVHMKQLKSNNLNQAHSCHSRLLEARRTLDGLLHAVNTTYHEMMLENDKIAVANRTIEQALADHERASEKFIDDRESCEYEALAANQSLVFLEADILELQSIANPLRSTISLTTDYVQDTITREVNEDTRVHNQYDSLDGLDVEAFTRSLVNNVAQAGGLNPGDDVTNGTLTDTGFSGGFIELSADAGAGGGELSRLGVLDAGTSGQMTSLLERRAVRAEQRRSQPGSESCINRREILRGNFNDAWTNVTTLYNRINKEIGYNRTHCLKNASWIYNYTVLGPGGVDERITGASQTIHVAQQTIMVLLPRLHDLEHAVTQMRTHITNLNDTCRVDARVTVHLQTIQQLIHDMQECPGRNNFTLTIPKWSSNRVATPPPTPYGRMPGLPSGHPGSAHGHVQQATLYDYEFGAARRRGDTLHDAQRNDWQEQYEGRAYAYSEAGHSPGNGRVTVT